MKRAMLFLGILFIAIPTFAMDCTGQLTHLGALYQIRSMMMRRYTSSGDIERFIDRRIEELREPLPDGGYRWVRWMRPTGSERIDKNGHTSRAGQGRGDPNVFGPTGQHS